MDQEILQSLIDKLPTFDPTWPKEVIEEWTKSFDILWGRVAQVEGKVIVDAQLLARWYFTLNKFEWPNDLPGKPENWDSLSRSGNISTPPGSLTRHDIVAPMMAFIKHLVGEKQLRKLYKQLKEDL